MIPESEGGGWASTVFNERGASVFTCHYARTKEGAIRDATAFAQAQRNFESYEVRPESYAG
jgi:hypothetical protein